MFLSPLERLKKDLLTVSSCLIFTWLDSTILLMLRQVKFYLKLQIVCCLIKMVHLEKSLSPRQDFFTWEVTTNPNKNTTEKMQIVLSPKSRKWQQLQPFKLNNSEQNLWIHDHSGMPSSLLLFFVVLWVFLSGYFLVWIWRFPRYSSSILLLSVLSLPTQVFLSALNIQPKVHWITFRFFTIDLWWGERDILTRWGLATFQ